MTRLVIATGLLLGTLGLWAQEKPIFEAASIHAIPSAGSQVTFDLNSAGRLTARSNLWNLIRQAYGWRDSEIVGGPAWIRSDSDGFEIRATASSNATTVDRTRALQMLQALLEERFHFRWHQEMREMPAYALKIAPGGSKLAPAKEGPPGRMQMGNLSTPSQTLDSLCQILEFETRRPVVNQTGLKESYAIELQWARDIPGKEPDTSKPSLFTALQEQLGLRLESAKLPVKVYVIDEVQRPSEN